MKTRSLYTLDNLMRKRDFPFQINLKGLQFFKKNISLANSHMHYVISIFSLLILALVDSGC